MPPSNTSKMMNQARDEARKVSDSMGSKDLRKEVEKRASELADGASAKAEEASRTVAESFSKAAEKLRQSAPENDRAGQLFNSVANKLDQAGGYLKRADLRSFGQDCTNSIRRHPVQAALIGLGIGMLIAQVGRRGARGWTEQGH